MAIKSFAALDFVGFKRPTVKEQPPVFDPKTGQQYDLSNPDLPLAVSPAFTVHYWLMPKTQAFVLKYLNERYDFFNHTRFGGKLSKPKLVVTSSGSTALDLKIEACGTQLKEKFTSQFTCSKPHTKAGLTTF